MSKLSDHSRELERARDIRAAARDLVELLEDYYFVADDEELAALNRIRALVGLEPQKPKERR